MKCHSEDSLPQRQHGHSIANVFPLPLCSIVALNLFLALHVSCRASTKLERFWKAMIKLRWSLAESSGHRIERTYEGYKHGSHSSDASCFSQKHQHVQIVMDIHLNILGL